MCGDNGVSQIAVFLLVVKQLSAVHSSHGCGRDEWNLTERIAGETCLIQGFTKCKTAEKCRAGEGRIIGNTQHTCHFGIAKLHFSHRNVLMTG